MLEHCQIILSSLQRKFNVDSILRQQHLINLKNFISGSEHVLVYLISTEKYCFYIILLLRTWSKLKISLKKRVSFKGISI